MRYEEVLITPDMAREFLKNNDTNRRYEPKRARQYAQDMLAGKWELNGEDIEISVSGVLKNGQHRLNAIIIANIPVLMGIKYDVPDNITIYDRGRLRSSQDILLMKGMDKSLAKSTYVGIVRFHYAYVLNLMYATDSEIEQFLEKHKESFYMLSRLIKGRATNSNGTRVNCKIVPLLASIFYAYESGVPEETLDTFLRVLHTGIPDSLDQSAALVLRNGIQSLKEKYGWEGRKKLACMCEKAIYDFAHHYQRINSYANESKQIYSNLFKEDN